MLHEIKNVAFVYLDDTTFELPPFGYVGDKQIIWKKKKKKETLLYANSKSIWSLSSIRLYLLMR